MGCQIASKKKPAQWFAVQAWCFFLNQIIASVEQYHQQLEQQLLGHRLRHL